MGLARHDGPTTLTAQLYYVALVGRVENAPHKVGHTFQRVRFLFEIVVSIIDAFYSGYGVPKGALRNVIEDTRPCHERAAGAPEIMLNPWFHPGYGLQQQGI